MDLKIEKVLSILSHLLIAAAALILILMMVHVIADVALKYLKNSPIPGTAEIVANYYMVGVVFLPLPMVELNNRSIYVDLFYNRMGPVLQRITLFFGYGAQVAFFGILAWRSSLDSISAYKKGDLVEGIVNIIVWPGHFFLPIGFWLACAICVLRMLQILTRPDWAGAVAPKEQDNASEAV